MKLPESLRIAHVDIVIEEWTSKAAYASHRWGEWSVGEMVIRIQTENRQFSEVVCTLLHEIMHALCWALEIHLPEKKQGDSEERMVSTMSVGLAQVFRDNPELVQFLASGEVEVKLTLDEWIRFRDAEAKHFLEHTGG